MNNFSGIYEGESLERIAFPVGGLGAGMFCIEGSGALSHFSVQNRPDLWNAPLVFSALSFKEQGAETTVRVLEGPVSPWKLFFPWDRNCRMSGSGAGASSYGLPRFASARFTARFPFADIALIDDEVPLVCSVQAWSPFIPGDADNSGLPLGVLEYRFKNPTAAPIEAVYSFHMRNDFRKAEGNRVTGLANGFVLRQDELPDDFSVKTDFAAWVDSPNAKVNLVWFRGGWFDPLTMIWRSLVEGELPERPEVSEGAPSPGGCIHVPLQLAPGEEKTVRLTLSWRSPWSSHQTASPVPIVKNRYENYRPWYAEKFPSIEAVVEYWNQNRNRLRAATETFTDCFYDSTLPPEMINAIAANLCILKSPTVLRQFDGRLWAWEGCQDDWGSCHGTCTHVWNYAQAVSHLFPALERTLRETEFLVSQDKRGHQSFRTELPIGPAKHDFYAAADGQLGGLVKLYRDWRISGDTAWLRKLWPAARQSLDFCIGQWDPDHRGVLVEPHHNTYDIEFWGPDGMCTSFYLAALHAAGEMGRALGDDVEGYDRLLAAGREFVQTELYNGDYFYQKIQWEGLRAENPVEAAKIGINMNYSAEAKALLRKEGPKYQYGTGCLSDGVLGEWMAWTAGLEPTLDVEKIRSHLLAIYRHNFIRDLSKMPNPQRPAYAFGHEAGLLLCSWPRGGRLSLPFPYSDEVWTGIEYQVAAHLISFHCVEEGLEIVRACRRRYDGRIRNPFDEIECGRWYGRALSSYALLQAYTGARFDAVDGTLHLDPRLEGDFRSFFSTATGFGTVGMKDGKPFLEVRAGDISPKQIKVVLSRKPAAHLQD